MLMLRGSLATLLQLLWKSSSCKLSKNRLAKCKKIIITRGVTVHQISCVIHGVRSSSLASSAVIVFQLFCFPLIIPASDLASLSCFCFHFYS